MADHNQVKERGLDKLRAQFVEMTKGVVDDNGVAHPNGVGPWSGDATPEQIAVWQAYLDENGTMHPEAELTRHLLYLAKWVASTEEINSYEDPEQVPAKVQKAAQRAWDAKPKEPKVRERKQTIQMFLALPPGRSAEYGNFPAGILYQTLESPLSVEDLGKMVVKAFPESKYRENPIGRMKIDIGKFNNAAFACQHDEKPSTKYPLIGLEKKESKEKDGTETVASEG